MVEPFNPEAHDVLLAAGYKHRRVEEEDVPAYQDIEPFYFPAFDEYMLEGEKAVVIDQDGVADIWDIDWSNKRFI